MRQNPSQQISHTPQEVKQSPDNLLPLLPDLNYQQQSTIILRSQTLPSNFFHILYPNLTCLSLKFCQIENLGKCMNGVNFPMLSQLNLKGNKLDLRCMRQIGQELQELISLDLSHNPIFEHPDSQLEAFSLNKLIYLNLSDTKLNSKSMDAFKLIEMPSLRILELANNHIDFEGIKLFNTQMFKQLKILNLNYNLIGNLGVQELCKIQFSELKQFSLSDNIWEFGFQKLQESALYNQAEHLDLRGNIFNRLNGEDQDTGYAGVQELGYLRNMIETKIEQFDRCRRQ